MRTWNEQETDKCWEEVKSILTGELFIGVPTYVSENHGCVVVHRGTNFPLGDSDAESNETGCVRMAHSDTNRRGTVERRGENETRAEELDGAYRDQNGSQTANMLTTW